jgi:hypothetical protein
MISEQALFIILIVASFMTGWYMGRIHLMAKDFKNRK